MKKNFFSKNLVYRPRLFLKKYDDNYYKLVYMRSCRMPGFSDCFDTVKYYKEDITYYSFVNQKNNIKQKKDRAQSVRSALSRSKSVIRDLVLCNNFTYFATFTVAEPIIRQNLSKSQELILKLFHAEKRRNKDFKYLLVTEQHKDGSFHFHGVVTEFSDLYLNGQENPKTHEKYYSSKLMDNLGYQSYSKIRNKDRCASYIMKYLTKDTVRVFGKQSYFCSKNLNRPIREELLIDTDVNNFDFNYNTKYCRIADIRI